MGGAPESSALFLGSLKNLTTGAGAKAWGGGPGGDGAPESS